MCWQTFLPDVTAQWTCLRAACAFLGVCFYCCDPQADPVDTWLDTTASALTDPKATAVIYINVSALSLFFLRIVTRQAEPSRLALLIISSLVLSFHPVVS
jgi:hypothetical protein